MNVKLQRGLVRLALLGGMVAVGVFTGLLVGWMGNPAEMQDWWMRGAPWWPVDLSQSPWESMFYGILYATAIWSTILGVRELAYRFVPVRSWRGLLVHVGANSAMVMVVFVVINLMDPWICAWITGADPSDAPPLATVAIVAFGAAMLITTLTYAVDFYRAMQDAKRATLEAELRALRAQINPHFLFNTLNSIAALVHTRPDEAEHVIEELAELFRYTLQASQHPTVTLAEEFKATDRYIAIEQARFRDRMVVSRTIDDGVLDAQVPSLLVQPLVENAVKHGVANIESVCALCIEAHHQAGGVTLRVRDTGPGFSTTDPDVIFGRGTGLANVRDRLHRHYGPDAHLSIKPDGVTLHFPYHAVHNTEGVSRRAAVPHLI